ncbi:hypothetical protein [Ectobacillus ponti]|uniref:Uncharacterized protein n=1 Tax=Ectobacillus ponti TaxID=2961894 RepID=A0AA41X6Z3_9BACI|nr:hypothetical protein [Ectobacillus ponti]MCP8968343.1 hypothetical protein [Ectobacillus ponti]
MPGPPAGPVAAGAAFTAFSNSQVQANTVVSFVAASTDAPYIIDDLSVGVPLPLLEATVLRDVEHTELNGYKDSLSTLSPGIYSINYDLTLNRSLSTSTVQFAVIKFSADQVVTTLSDSFTLSGAANTGITNLQNGSTLVSMGDGDSLYIAVTAFDNGTPTLTPTLTPSLSGITIPSLDTDITLEQVSLRIIQIP